MWTNVILKNEREEALKEKPEKTTEGLPSVTLYLKKKKGVGDKKQDTE